VFDETFELNLAQFSAQQQLYFGVYDFDRYSRHDLIGAAVLQPHSQEGTAERLYVLDLTVEKQVQCCFDCCWHGGVFNKISHKNHNS